jgi:hypothetical protein
MRIRVEGLESPIRGVKVFSMNRVTLYSFASDNIKITIEAFFDEHGHLVIEGYDIGAVVEDAFGDSDYEYTTTIHSDHLEKLNVALGLPVGSREEILVFLKTHYNGNACYSQIQTYLAQHDIPCERFSWM